MCFLFPLIERRLTQVNHCDKTNADESLMQVQYQLQAAVSVFLPHSIETKAAGVASTVVINLSYCLRLLCTAGATASRYEEVPLRHLNLARFHFVFVLDK